MAIWQQCMSLRSRRPFLLRIRSSKWFITTTVCTIVFTDVFLYGVVVPVLPFALGERCKIPEDDIQHWVSTLFAVYGAMLVLGSPISGMLADRFKSRRGPLLFGLFALAGSTLMLCLGRSIGVLLAARIFQGLSAAMSWTVALALLADSIKKEETGQALGYISISYSLGILVAPLIGGVVYQRSGYYAVFGLTFGVIVLDIILRLLIVETREAIKWRDPQDDVTPSSNNLPLNKTAGDFQSHSLPTVETNFTNDQLTTAHTTTQQRRLPPILILLKSYRILTAFFGTFVASALMCGFDATLPLFVNRTFGWDALGAGLIFLTLLLPSLFGPLLGRLCDKYGASLLSTIGFAACIPFLVLLRLVDHDSVGQIVLLCALLTGVGASLALTLVSLITEFSKVCDEKERDDPALFGSRSAYAQSYGIYNVAWGSGALIGPLWAGGVETQAGWGTMTWSLSLLSALSVPFVAVFTDGSVYKIIKDKLGR